MISDPLTDVDRPKPPIASMDSPVFIVGMSRSGTTLLSRMLDAHSEIAILPETWWYVVLDRLGCFEEFTNPWQTALFFHEVWGNLKSYRDPAAQVVAREAAKEPRYLGPTAQILERIGNAYAKERHAQIWGEKTPGHALWLPQIRELFPQARVLFTVRDPRDVIVSYDDRWDQGRRDTEYIVDTAALLKHFLSHLLRLPGFPTAQVHWVRYEALTAQPQAELEQVCRFLGVAFEPAMLGFYHKYSNVEREMAEGRHHALLSKPATTEKIGRYREALTDSQIALVERFLADEMRALGYPLSSAASISITPKEQRAFAKAEQHYRQMVSGAIRRKFRRKGKLKLGAYRLFGRVLDLVPAWRVATSGEDWQSLADGDLTPG